MITAQKTIPVLDIESIRNQFPVLNRTVKGKPLVYFDNAATSQKPKKVLEALQNYYEHNKDKAYCQIIIAPKLVKLQERYKNLLA